jgi:dTMP kinase
MSARFIVLEGVEGAGKSTQLALLERWLREQGVDPVATREPGGTRVGERIRALLLAPEQGALAAESELLLMFAARAQHLSEVIRPALAAGRWVLCDRFTDASYAYQGAGRGMGSEAVAVLENWLQWGFRPDLVLVLDLSVAEGMRRARGRGGADRFESESAEFFDKVRRAYLDRVNQDPSGHRLVAAGADAQSVHGRIREIVKEFAGGELD